MTATWVVRRWPFGALIAVSALAAGIVAYLLSQHLFVFSEARHMIAWPYDLDPARFLLLPHLQWGNGRLSAIATFQLTGQVCGVDHACVNLVGSGMVGLATAALLVHTRQLLGRVPDSLAVALLWVASPAVLGVLLWQSARFDLLAFIAAMVTSAFWWEMLGRRSLSSRSAVAFVLVSVALLALAFNAKELTYYLVGALVILALVRGHPVGAARRNLLLAVVPLAYAAWFIGYGLLTIDPDYAANNDLAHIPENLDQLVRSAFGVDPGYMGVWQVSPAWDQLQALARVGYLLAAAGVVAAAVLVLRRLDRGSLPWSLLVEHGVAIYLVAILGAMMVMNARSAGASAYYMVVPWWAILTLGAYAIRRLVPLGPVARALALGIVSAFVLGASLAVASHFTERSTFRTLIEASDRMRDIGSTIRLLLDGRPVEQVSWRTIGEPRGRQYVVRGVGELVVGDEIWPWLVRDPAARPEVTALAEGDADSLRQRLPEFDAPGEVLVVLSEDYRLELLAWEGHELFYAPTS